MIDQVTGLFKDELEAYEHIQEAWKIIRSLPEQNSSDRTVAGCAIVTLQGLLAQRITRRQFPEGWPPDTRDLKKD